MKGKLLYLMIFIGVLAACENPIGGKDPEPPSLFPKTDREKYLVDSITWYDDATNHYVTHYNYDANNRLVKQISYRTYREQGEVKKSIMTEDYEYTNGNLTKITHKDSYVKFDHNVILYYDDNHRLIKYRSELINGSYESGYTYFGYHNNRVDSVWSDSDPNCYSLLRYDSYGNITKVIKRVAVCDMFGQATGEYEFRELNYEYDDKLRPFFNTDNAFVHTPYFGAYESSTPDYVRLLSRNNLIKYSAHTWEYTYNEIGLPVELIEHFEGVTYVNNPKHTFTYRKIE